MRHLILLCVCCTIAAGTAWADDDEDSRYFVLGFDGGWAWATSDGSDLWQSGASAGINFFYPLNSFISIGGRAALDRWILDGDAAVGAVVPPGATVTYYESDGQLKIIEITPLLRLSRDQFLWKRMAGFLQLGGGAYRISYNAETIVDYTDGGSSETVVASANGSDYRGGVTAGAGLSFTIHEDSRLDIYPAYNAIFENNGTTEYITLLIAFRVVFSPWADR